VDVKINRKNDRWLAHEDISIIAGIKCPANVQVLGVVSSEDDVIPPHFFKNKEMVTKEVYVNVLASVVKPWMETVASGRPYVFQQDGAPAHTSHLSKTDSQTISICFDPRNSGLLIIQI